MANASIRVARAQSAEEEAAIKRLYPEYIRMQFGTADQLSRNLDNQYSQFARQTILDEMGRDMGPSALENQMRGLGASAMSYRPDQISAPTNIRNVRANLASAAQMGPVRDVRGVNAQRVADVRSRDVAAAQMGGVANVNAVNARRVADINAQDVQAGALGGSLMQQAIERSQSGGRLSAEASRDAVQSARSGMAARGMATGSAGLAAELLNRDRYARARQTEDNAFASAVQGQDLQRQFSNQEAAMRAAMANQQMSGQMSLADQAAAMDAQRLNQAAGLTVGQTNAQFQQQAGLANQDAFMRAGLANQALAGQMSLADQAAMMDAQRLNQASDLTRGQTDAQFAQQTALANQAARMDAQRLNQVRDTTLGQFLLNAQMANQEANMNQVNNNRGFLSSVSQQALANDQMRSQRRLGLGTLYGDMDPYRQALGPAFNLGGSTLNNTTSQIRDIYGGSLQQAGNIASFNTNMGMSLRNSALNNNAAMQAAAMQAGATQNAGMMGMFGNIAGGVLGGATSALRFSDKRMKKDIKPLGKAGSVLGLTAYEFSYKGDDKKHKGFMAQDVAKVLPEAVAEVDYKGKKRLAIKPAVIGAALAEELMAAKAA
jgi:hypothetical protein